MERDRESSKGYGFIVFDTEEEANAAIEGLNGTPLGNEIITVVHAEKRRRGSSEGRGGRGGFRGRGGRGGSGGRGGRGGYTGYGEYHGGYFGGHGPRGGRGSYY